MPGDAATAWAGCVIRNRSAKSLVWFLLTSTCVGRGEGAKNAARRIDAAAAAVGVGNIIHKEGGCQFLSGEGGGRSMKIPEYRLKATDTHDGERGALIARSRLRECRRRVVRRPLWTLPRKCPRTRSARYIGQLEAQPLLDRATTLKLRPIRMWERMKKIGWKLRRRRAGKR